MENSQIEEPDTEVCPDCGRNPCCCDILPDGDNNTEHGVDPYLDMYPDEYADWRD